MAVDFDEDFKLANDEHQRVLRTTLDDNGEMVTEPEMEDQAEDEETQDFRFLSSILAKSRKGDGEHRKTRARSVAAASRAPVMTTTIPKRGEKDFEANATRKQAQVLQASREAMHDALAVERVHSIKSWVVGYLVGNQPRGDSVVGAAGNGAPTAVKDKEEQQKREGRLAKCVVRIDRPKGGHFRTMGVSDSHNRIWLLPEEALYLIERGSLDVRWGAPDASNEGEEQEKTASISDTHLHDRKAVDMMNPMALSEQGLQAEDQSWKTRSPTNNGSENETHGKRYGDGTSKYQIDDQSSTAGSSLSELPMSLQGAYSTFITDAADLPLARYTVFAGLRRSGYTVVRPSLSGGSDKKMEENRVLSTSTVPMAGTVGLLPTFPSPSLDSRGSSLTTRPSGQQLRWRTSSVSRWLDPRSLFIRLFGFLYNHLFNVVSATRCRENASCSGSFGPLVAPGLYKSYADIFRALGLIPFHDPVSRPESLHHLSSATASVAQITGSSTVVFSPRTQTHPPFQIHYHVYKPSTPFRKTSRPPPDFYLSVIDARSDPIIPSLVEIGVLLDEMPIYDPQQQTDGKLSKARPELRLRTGTRSAILAVVDGGVVTFFRAAEMGSGREPIFEPKTTRNRKGGGGGKRGRGARGKGHRGRIRAEVRGGRGNTV